MAISQVTPHAATAAAVPRIGARNPSAPRNRVVVVLAAVVDVFREARELEMRMLGQGGYHRGES